MTTATCPAPSIPAGCHAPDRLPAKWRTLLSLLPGYDPTRDADGCWFDPDAAQLALDFFPQCLKHVEGDQAGEPFHLQPWQQSVIANLFGWKRKDRKDRIVRRYREAFIYVPRGNGKTTFAAGICLYVLLCDNEAGAQVYSAAAEREQAALLFRHAKGMVEQEPELSERCRVYGATGMRSIVLRNDEASSYKVLSSEAFSKHGFNTHCAVVDELHAHDNRDLVDVLRTSMGKANRKQPLMVYITTADYLRESICNEKYDYACKVRDGIVVDSTFLPVVYEATSETDWTNPDTWRSANPNYGVSVSEDYLEEECRKAKEIPEYENTFKRLHLNMRTESDVRWLSGPLWEANGTPFDPAALKGRLCYAGLDLASTTDSSALVLAFPPVDAETAWHVLPWFWVPDKFVKMVNNRTTYGAWVAKGQMVATPGDVTDYSFIREKIRQVCQDYRVQKLAYDPYNATHLALELQTDGVTVEEFVQSVTNYNEPCCKLEELLLSRNLRHGNHPVLRWHAANVSVRVDGRGYKMPWRKQSTGKIDGIAALLMSLGKALAELNTPPAVEVW